MALTLQGSELPTVHRRTLYRRSSCPSIPRSVSTCNSIYAIDFSGKFSSVQKDCDDVEMYMSPLFRGLGGIGEEHGEVAELMPATSTGSFTPSAQAIDSDDSLSDSLSNYEFDITGHDLFLFPEPTKASEDKLPTEQSSTHTQPRPPMIPDKPLKPKASQLFPPPRDPSSSPERSSPSVPPSPTRPVVPMKSGTTRPLKIDRSRKRTGPSVTSQRSPRAEAQNVAPTSKPILRATTHVNLREVYRRDRLLSERKVSARSAIPAVPSYPHPHAEIPDRNVAQVNSWPSPDTFASYRFIPLHSKSLSLHCFQLVSFLLIVRKINSRVPTVWTNCHLNPILLTLRHFLRGTTVSGRVGGLSGVHLKGRRALIDLGYGAATSTNSAVFSDQGLVSSMLLYPPLTLYVWYAYAIMPHKCSFF